MKSYYKKGFTIIEMVLVVALISMITMVISAFLSQSVKSYRVKRQSADLEEKAAHAMRDFEWQARAANKILIASSSEFKFLRFFDLSSSVPTQVRYFMDGTSFKIGLTKPVGIEPNISYPEENEEIALIIDDVTTEKLFKFFDGNGEELTEPIIISNVKMVSLNISLDKNGTLPPAPIIETTKVTLRNMKDNL